MVARPCISTLGTPLSARYAYRKDAAKRALKAGCKVEIFRAPLPIVATGPDRASTLNTATAVADPGERTARAATPGRVPAQSRQQRREQNQRRVPRRDCQCQRCRDVHRCGHGQAAPHR